jgi:cell division protein FtsW
MVHGVAPAETGDAILPRWWRTVDRWTIFCVFLLFAVGLLLGLAASPPLAERQGQDPFYYVQRQMMYGLLALTAMLLVSMASPAQVRRFGTMLFAGSFLAVALLPLFGTDFGKGAVRWFSLGFGSVQPSEFLKPGFVVFTAWLMTAAQEPEGPPGRLLSLAVLGAVLGFLVIQPDFGQAALVLFSWTVMYFLAGASIFLLLGIGGGVLLAGAIFYNNSEHFARRIDGFLSAEVDPRTQIGFATDAIREGGFFGVGVAEGQVRWNLPDAHTDFIIAVAAEEYGLVLVLAIMGLYATILLRALFLLLRERDTFVRLAAAGLVCTFTVQAMVNIGVAVRLLPTKGMTLPFVSYGGSSLLATGMMLGMLLALTRVRAQGRLGDILGSGRRAG